MAWKWANTAKNGGSEEWTGFIDQGVMLEGTLTVTGTFRIDGHVKGNIISEQTVILGEGAKVEGQIEGNRVVIAGRFDGVIFAKGRVEIQVKGVVTERGPDGRPLRVRVTGEDELGRVLQADGECVNVLRYPCFTFWLDNWCLTRWTFDGQEAWGEEQDFIQLQQHRRFLRAVRAQAGQGR